MRAAQHRIHKMTLFDFTLGKTCVFHIEIGEITIMKKTVFKIRREKGFVTFKKFTPYDFTIDKERIL